MKVLWIGLAILVLLVPLGMLASGVAWGEWGANDLEAELGFVPHGFASLSGLWQAPIPDYEVPGLNGRLGYILSGVLGVGIVVLATWGLGRILTKP